MKAELVSRQAMNLAMRKANADPQAAADFAAQEWAKRYQAIFDHAQGITDAPEAIAARLERIQQEFGPEGIYLALYQAAGSPELRSSHLEFQEQFPVDDETLSLVIGKKALSSIRVSSTADASDIGVEEQKIATVQSRNGGQITFVNPLCKVNTNRGEDQTHIQKDDFVLWGQHWWQPHDLAIFVPVDISHRLRADYREQHNMLNLVEEVCFTNPDVKDFPIWTVEIDRLRIDDRGIQEDQFPRLAQVLQQLPAV